MKAQAALLLIAILGLIGLVGYIAPGLGVRTYLHSHATLWTHITSPDGRFAVATYRFPELHDLPEILGFGQGFMQVLDTRSGKVVVARDADDLTQLNTLLWGTNELEIPGFLQIVLPD